MTRGFYDLTSGMLSQTRRLDVVGNNMTNVTTAGYKQETYTDTTFQEVLLSRTGSADKSNPTPIGQASYMLVPSELYVNHDQGIVEETGLTLDFAIYGDGYFAIETDNGVEYTRNGNFSLDNEGYLYLPNHGRVLGADQQPIHLDTDYIEADDTGRIYNAGDKTTVYGQLGVFTFADQQQLVKNESGLFGANGQQPVASNAQVMWKNLESSNVDMLQEMSRMMTAQRALQGAASVLQIYDGVLTKATSDVGRL